MAARGARAAAKSLAACTACGSIISASPCRDLQQLCPRLPPRPRTRRRNSLNLSKERGEVVVDGKRLETLWIGREQSGRPVIVMLHEGLGSAALWKDFPEQLAAGTRCAVLLYSRYGHGNSDKLLEKRPVAFMHYEGEVVLPELLDK